MSESGNFVRLGAVTLNAIHPDPIVRRGEAVSIMANELTLLHLLHDDNPEVVECALDRFTWRVSDVYPHLVDIAKRFPEIVLSFRGCDSFILEFLSKSSDSEVRVCVARHSATSIDTVRRLLNDPDDRVRRNAFKSVHLTSQDLMKGYLDSDIRTRIVIAKHRNLTDGLADKMLSDERFSVLEAIAQNVHLSEGIRTRAEHIAKSYADAWDTPKRSSDVSRTSKVIDRPRGTLRERERAEILASGMFTLADFRKYGINYGKSVFVVSHLRALESAFIDAADCVRRLQRSTGWDTITKYLDLVSPSTAFEVIDYGKRGKRIPLKGTLRSDWKSDQNLVLRILKGKVGNHAWEIATQISLSSSALELMVHCEASRVAAMSHKQQKRLREQNPVLFNAIVNSFFYPQLYVYFHPDSSPQSRNLVRESSDPDIQEGLVRVMNVDELTTAALSTNRHVRVAVAHHKLTPVQVLEKLSVDEVYQVREKVAGNSNTPQSALTELAFDQTESVRLAMTKNIALPIDVLTILSMDKSDHVRREVLKHPNANDIIRAQVYFSR